MLPVAQGALSGDGRNAPACVGLATALVALSLVLAAPASAGVFGPPAGKVLWGGQGGYGAGNVADFARQSGKKPATYQFFVTWSGASRDLGFIGGRLAVAQRMKTRAMFHLSTKGTRHTPRSLSRGGGDGFLLGLNRLLADHGTPVYIRPLSEMNNGANPYSPYDLAGRSRGRAYSASAFRAAWRRLALILRGGDVATINRKLRRLGLPRVQSSRATLPRPKVALLWVPLSFGNPEMARNHPRHFWPGSRYVDWVGTTWYSPFRNSRAFDRFYRYPAWRRKPFVFAEFAVWGAERPAFISQFFNFVHSHRRVKMVTYYQSALLKPAFRLSTHPRSRAVLRRRLASSRFVGTPAEFAKGPR